VDARRGDVSRIASVVGAACGVNKDSARPRSKFLHSITGTPRANSQDRSVDMYRYTNEVKAQSGKVSGHRRYSRGGVARSSARFSAVSAPSRRTVARAVVTPARDCLAAP